jgi:putative ABC transport system permease protein
MKQLGYEIVESIAIAIEQVYEHRMRSLLTALGVMIGIIAVTLMGSAIRGIDVGFTSNLSILGMNTFYLEKWPWKDVGDNWIQYRNRPPIPASYSEKLNNSILSTENSSLIIAVPMVKNRRKISKDDRNIQGVEIIGTNADYPLVDNAEIELGRFLSEVEVLRGRNVVVLGHEVAASLFPEDLEESIGAYVNIQDIKYKVTGVYKKQGSVLGIGNFDKNVLMPLPSMRKFFVSKRYHSATIKIQKKEEASFEDATDEITGAVRLIRGLKPGQKDNFSINQSTAVAEEIAPVKRGIAIAGFGITGLALFVGAIGIMNITFVSVQERTKEIGTRRAIGARKRAILIQFLMEANMICLIGGIIGVFISFLIKLVLQRFIPEFPLIMSGQLILVAMLVSVLTGIGSGIAPAWKASRLDPAEALRHE